MLNDIFNEYTAWVESEGPGKWEMGENEAEEVGKYEGHKKDKNDFWNESKVLPKKEKTKEIMDKYCTLYKSKPEPLNVAYLKKKAHREELSNTAGAQWFNMKAPELTPEWKEDLKALALGKYADPSNFHKKNDKQKYEKFFQIGRISDNIWDGKNSRLKKSQVRNRIIEEVLDNDLNKNYTTKKFEKYQEQRRKIGLKKYKLNKYKLKSKGKSKGGVGVISK